MKRMGIAFVITLAAGCGGGSSDTSGEPAGSVPIWEELCPGDDQQLVAYKAQGTARTISHTTETPTGTSQGAGERLAAVNDTYRLIGAHCFPRGAFVYAAFQNETDQGSVTCVIEIDEVEVARTESQGAYVIVQCDA